VANLLLTKRFESIFCEGLIHNNPIVRYRGGFPREQVSYLGWNMQAELDKKNEEFWNELCGSSFAKAHGIADHSISSLEKFDREYLKFYPYLLKHVPVHTMKGKKVMEVGLGYGTLGQQIAMAGAHYTGLDIAHGPVSKMKHRLALCNLPGTAIQGSILNCPLPSESLDCVVSIGCLHHTGDLKRALEETYRVLRKGGEAYLMLYNQRSYRQWWRWPTQTLRSVMGDYATGYRAEQGNQHQRAAYDANSAGEAAPATEFSSIMRLKRALSPFSSVSFTKENADSVHLYKRLHLPRDLLLGNLGRLLGLDIYLKAVK
jgi:ubiquinone/menaquinone biosynthesis C-methylase UbiE